MKCIGYYYYSLSSLHAMKSMHVDVGDANVLGLVHTAAARWVPDVAGLEVLIMSGVRNELKFAAAIVGVLHPAGGTAYIPRWSSALLPQFRA